jgi:chaperone modulatory protein CbpM
MTTTLHVSLQELCNLDGINEQIVVEVVEHGIVNPLSGEDISEWVFDTVEAAWLKKAIRLQRDLEIDWVAVAMVIELLQHKQSLEQENQRLQQRLQRFLLED